MASLAKHSNLLNPLIQELPSANSNITDIPKYMCHLSRMSWLYQRKAISWTSSVKPNPLFYMYVSPIVSCNSKLENVRTSISNQPATSPVILSVQS